MYNKTVKLYSLQLRGVIDRKNDEGHANIHAFYITYKKMIRRRPE